MFSPGFAGKPLRKMIRTRNFCFRNAQLALAGLFVDPLPAAPATRADC
jgi:hypothetical protein